MSGPRPLIVVIDDDPDFHALVDYLLSGQGYRTSFAADLKTGLALLTRDDPAAVLLDRQLGGEDGVERIGDVLRTTPLAPVILVTAHSSTELAVRAIRNGAFDFLTKPLDEARLFATLAKAVEHHELLVNIEDLRAGKQGQVEFEGLLGGSPQMQTVFQIVANVAPSDASVMIRGESGTGKELVARAIHRRSSRAKGPFVALNMAALPAELVESTLFGHERGAFTGADRRHIGACEEAEGGTLFLDEIGEMPLDLQPKLLRVLQERAFRRVGGFQDIQADVRVVSATNRDPAAEAQAGRMRNDLYYRLHVVPIVLPPLRERRGDIELLAYHALRDVGTRYGKLFDRIDPAALDCLATAPWPGNVRQLLHVVEQCVVLNEGPVLTASMLPSDLDRQLGSTDDSAPAEPMPAVQRVFVPTKAEPREPEEIEPLAELERNAILRALEICDGSAAEAARRLGISAATIYRKLKAYDAESAG